MADPILSVLQQALASGSHSSALNPLGLLGALSLPEAISRLSLNSTTFLSSVLERVCVTMIMGTYACFAITEKHTLNNAKYLIAKKADFN